jgi:hypothetical protein
MPGFAKSPPELVARFEERAYAGQLPAKKPKKS